VVVDLAHVTAGTVAGVEAVVLVLAVVRLRAGLLGKRSGGEDEGGRGGRRGNVSFMGGRGGGDSVVGRCKRLLFARARDWPEALSGAEQRQAERSE
jgi:hypothetical protein